MFVWMNKTASTLLAVPCWLVSLKCTHHDRIVIKTYRRHGKQLTYELKTVVRRNVYTLADYMRIRGEVQRGQQEKCARYNERILTALESARIQGAIERV